MKPKILGHRLSAGKNSMSPLDRSRSNSADFAHRLAPRQHPPPARERAAGTREKGDGLPRLRAKREGPGRSYVFRWFMISKYRSLRLFSEGHATRARHDRRPADCHRPCFHFIVARQDTSTTRTPRSAAKPNSEDSNAPPRTAPSSADGLTTPRRTPSLVRNP